MSSEAKSVGQCIRALKNNIKLYWKNRRSEGFRRLLRHDIRLLRSYYKRREELQALKAARAISLKGLNSRLDEEDRKMEEAIVEFYRQLAALPHPPAESQFACWLKLSDENPDADRDVFNRAWGRIRRKQIIERYGKIGLQHRGTYRLNPKKAGGKTS